MANITFENISLVEKAVVLNFKSTEQKEISLIEIDKIYLKVHRASPFYVLLFIVISIIVIGFSFLLMDFDLILVLPHVFFFFGAVKLNNYKRYGMTIDLKNGGFLEIKVPLRSRYEAIDFVNKIRKELWICNTIL